jgi:hypothetical protein
MNMYVYEQEKRHLFTEEGQVLFLEIRDRANGLLDLSGAVRMHEAISGSAGIAWHMLACVDRMVELGEIEEVPQAGVAGQHRVFVRKGG